MNKEILEVVLIDVVLVEAQSPPEKPRDVRFLQFIWTQTPFRLIPFRV